MSTFSEVVEQAYEAASRQVGGNKIWQLGMGTTIEHQDGPAQELYFYLRFQKSHPALEMIHTEVTTNHPADIFSGSEFKRITAFIGAPKELHATVSYARPVKPGLQVSTRVGQPQDGIGAPGEDDELWEGEILDLGVKREGILGEKTLKKLNRYPPIDYAQLGRYLKMDLEKSGENVPMVLLRGLDLTGLYDAYSWLNSIGKCLYTHITDQNNSQVSISTVREPKGIYANHFSMGYWENGWNISREQVDYLEATLVDLIREDIAERKYQIREITCHNDKSWLQSAKEFFPIEGFDDFMVFTFSCIDGSIHQKHSDYQLQEPLEVELGR